MAVIRHEYLSTKYLINTYDEVLETYTWLRNCLEYVFEDIPNLRITERIDFTSGETDYECDSLDEFKRYAFGKEISIRTLFIHASQAKLLGDSLAHICAVGREFKNEQIYTLASEDELVIVNLKDAMKNEKKQVLETNTVVIGKYEDKSVHIGDNNAISNSTLIKDSKNVESINFSKSKNQNGEKWYNKIVWQFIVPVIAAVIGAVIIAWLKLG